MLLSLSRQSTLVYLNKIGQSYDADVLNWKESIENIMNSSQVL